MKEKKGSGRGIRLLVIFVCVALVFAIVWGITTAIAKLTQYSESATIEAVVEDPEETPEDPPAAKEEEALPANTFDPHGFKEENGIRTYASGDRIGVAGIDISSYQRDVDWTQVKEAGIEFAMIRVGYRGFETGKLDLDDWFLSHIQGALDAGIEVGVYFFSQALTPEEAKEEAQYVLTWIEGYDVTYPVVFDWEEVEGPARTDEMNMLMLTACAEAFCQTIAEAGYKASVYFNQAYGYQQFNLVSLRDYDFWLAEYAPIPSFAYDVQMWQYTNEGTVPGISGPVDLNIAFR